MSKIKILFVVPYPGLLEMVNRVLENFLQKEKIEVEVKHTTVDRMPEISDKEYDAIVARGYSATKTEKNIQIKYLQYVCMYQDMILSKLLLNAEKSIIRKR